MEPGADHPGAKGTIDVVLVTDSGHTYIIDFKFGYQPGRRAKENEQLAFYACALVGDASRYGIHDRAGADDDLRHSPTEMRISGTDLTLQRVWEVPVNWLAQRAKTYREVVAKTALAIRLTLPPKRCRSLLNLGSHCEWCRAKTECPKQQGQFQTLTEAVEISDQAANTSRRHASCEH